MNIRRRTIILWYNKHKPDDAHTWSLVTRFHIEANVDEARRTFKRFGRAKKLYGRHRKQKQKRLEQFGKQFIPEWN